MVLKQLSGGEGLRPFRFWFSTLFWDTLLQISFPRERGDFHHAPFHHDDSDGNDDYSWYMMVNQLGWNNTYWSISFRPELGFLAFPDAAVFTAFPTSFLDAGRIDGLSEFGVYANCPAAGHPALSALGIFTFLGNWNSFLWPVIALDSKKNTPLRWAWHSSLRKMPASGN